jgi:hypothetical protein
MSGLSEYLKAWASQFHEHSDSYKDRMKAADAIDALESEVKRLTLERDQIIERCAEVCDQKRAALIQTGERWKAAGAYECAAAIRAMKNDSVA